MESEKEESDRVSKQVCLLIYDGECRLCVSTRQTLERVRARYAGCDIRFLVYQSEEARKALGPQYRPGRPDQAFLIQPSGEVLQGVEAFFPFLSHIPGGQFLRWCLRFSVVKRLADWSYRVVARYRYQWFGEVKPVRQLD